ncbi:MAG TPA: zf-HC2 domain-containing protein [Aeromicrobium sp.]|nr:zf-HC2 domain-containing protein [Aeromicrobium sp.]
MAHLGDDIAAYVDGQLPAPAMARADVHLADCERCQEAARQQRALKDRMRGGDLLLPPGLVQALGALPTAPPRRTRSLQAAVGAAMVVVGAALAVVAVAYSVAPSRHIGDPVAPKPERLASISDAFNRPGRHLGDRALDELHRAGWPSQRRLGYDHYRLDGRMHDGEEVVAQMYVGRNDVLVLVEQVGALDVDSLQSWEPRTVGDREVWVREGTPRVLTWDSDGMVYAVVTSLSDGELAHLLDDLPAPEPEPTPLERIGDGLVRMTSWLG